MNEHELLSYYGRELDKLRVLGKQFSQQHPQMAPHLQFELGFGKNPYLAQLLEGMAFLNANIAYQFDQDYPQLIAGLVENITPHLLAPIPSMAIVQWPTTPTLEKPIAVPRGSVLETDPYASKVCRFTTCYDVTAYPIQFIQAEFVTDLQTCPHRVTLDPHAVLKLNLAITHPAVTFQQLQIEHLPIYLSGDAMLTYPLYELLAKDCIGICYEAEGIEPQWLGAETLVPMGFEPEQALLPTDPRSFIGYRWLTEFFTLPQKFLFFDLKKIPNHLQQAQKLSIYLYFKQKPSQALQHVSSQQFQLGCTPIVNLFTKTIEPLQVISDKNQYRLVTDLRSPMDYEINHVEQIYSVAGQQQLLHYVPLFHPQANVAGYWQMQRVNCSQLSDCPYTGTEVLIELIHQNPITETTSLVVETLCSNRNLPELLLQQAELPLLQPAQGHIVPHPIQWQLAPTLPRAPIAVPGQAFTLLAHLSPQLSGHINDSGEQLKRILSLYAAPEQQELMNFIDQISDLTGTPCHEFVAEQGHYGFIQGTRLTLQLQKRPQLGYNPYVLLCVLNQFLSQQCALNSFIDFRVQVLNEEIYKWPVCIGNHVLV